jgi:hypothetical protein
MARPRTPKAKAKATGSDTRNPKRFEERQEPQNLAPIGEPPAFFTAEQITIWNLFKAELFWLNESHRSLLEIACYVRARLHFPKPGDEEVGVQKLNLLRQCLGQMGATPADASKVNIPDGEGPQDPSDKYFAKAKR